MKKATARLTPVRLKAGLIVAMIALLALGIGGFYLAFSFLTDRANEVSQKVAAAEASEDSVSELQQLEARLKELEGERERTESIMAGTSSYQYQDQVIRDLNRYASQAGLRISQFTFQEIAAPNSPGSSSPSSSSTPAPTPTPTPTPTPGAAGDSATTPAPAAAALKTATVNISLEQPVSYTSLLRFIKSIENNLTKMQLSGLTLSPGENRDLVSTDSLTIEVYIK